MAGLTASSDTTVESREPFRAERATGHGVAGAWEVLQGGCRLPVGTPLLLAAAGLMMLGGEPAQATWQYHRLAIADGQWWRLLTGHLAHISVEHFFWDALMFITLGSLVEWQSRARWLGVTLGSAVAISAGLWWLRPDMMWYRGLSGIDSALFACIMAGWLRHAGMRRLLGGLGLILLLGKAGYEWQAGQAIFVQFDQPHVTAEPLAHLIGGGVGAAVGWWRRVTGHLRCFR